MVSGTSSGLTTLAEEIAKLIIERKTEDRLRWHADGTIQVQTGKVFPADSAARQTVAERRKRLRRVLDQILADKR